MKARGPLRSAMGSIVLASLGASFAVAACGDDDATILAPQDGGADVRTPPPRLDAGPAEERDSGGEPKDAKVEASYPTPWDRSMSARDASLEASTKYCSPPEDGIGQFCWDFTFDDGITGWNEVLEDGGAHALVGGNAGEPLRALQSTVFADAGPGNHWVSLRYLINIDDIPDAAAGITLSFSFRAASVRAPTIIGALQLPTPSGPALRGLSVYPGGCVSDPTIPCVGENTYVGTDLGRRRPIETRQWYRARIHLQPSGLGTGTVTWASTITVGDAVIAQHDSDALPMTNTFPTSVNLFVGAFDTTGAGPTEVQIDDILLE